MGCLSQEQLARLALGLVEDAKLTLHLEQCAACRLSVEAMQSLRHELAEAHAKFDHGHEEARERLLALLPAANRPPEPAKPWKQITHWMGGLSMTQRIAVLGSVGVAALLGFLLLLGGIDGKPVSAMEQMAESIRKARSYKCTAYVDSSHVPEPGKQPVVDNWTGTEYWRAPDSSRYETRTRKGLKLESTMIYAGKDRPRLQIDHDNKTFTRDWTPARTSPSERLEELSNFSGNADRELGTRVIDGHKTFGFEIDAKKIDRWGGPGKAEIWLDATSNLPIRCRFESTESMAGCGFTSEVLIHFIIRIEDIQWNIDLDPKLFDPTPPAGYTDVSPKLDEQLRDITKSLRIYAEASGGNYPRVKTVDLRKTIESLCMMLGVPLIWPGNETTVKTLTGFAEIEGIQTHNPGAAYNGQTVGPKDKDKVLLRRKLDDGRYEVIFGDLRAETVAADRLRTLEGK